MAASVSECLWSDILESLTKLSKNFAVMMHYKKVSGMKYFVRKILALKIYDLSKFDNCEGVFLK